MGGLSGGKSSGNQSTSAQLTPQQTETLNLENNFLQSYIPTLTGTTSGANQVYQSQAPNVNQAASNAVNTANTAGNIQGNYGAGALGSGISGLESLFSPQYEQSQVAGALAPAMFGAQQANVGMNAGFAGAGEQGSAREALANQATQALNTQMLGNIAATTEAGISNARANAGQALGTLGTTNLNAAPTTIGSTIGYSAAPLSNYGQYASTIYGAPSQTPNYSGTQGSTSSGTSKGVGKSDIRLKRFVHALNYGLSEVQKLKPVSWLWKDSQAYGPQAEIGFVAQDVRQVIPEVIHEIEGILHIDYAKLTAVLTNAIIQQQAQIDALSKKLDEREVV